MTFTLPKISFFKRYVKILFSWGNLGLMFYYIVCCIVPILSGKLNFFVLAVICCIPLLITLIRPIFIAHKYIYEIKIKDNILIINYLLFNKKIKIEKSLENFKINYYGNGGKKIWKDLTFGQKVHGYNNKVFLTQYLFADWNNKEKLKEFVKFVVDNNITNNFKQINRENVKKMLEMTKSELIALHGSFFVGAFILHFILTIIESSFADTQS